VNVRGGDAKGLSSSLNRSVKERFECTPVDMLAYSSRARSKVARTTGARVDPRACLCRAAAPRGFGERHAKELGRVVVHSDCNAEVSSWRNGRLAVDTYDGAR
jgi:hypothetical protein